MLKEIKLSILKNEYLLQALNRQGKKFIPANAFVNKTLPGLGATYCELVAERDSIIIEPNVPVIISKTRKHKNTLAVIRGVQPQQIMEYIERTPIGKRKILTTPESFYKIIEAMKDAEELLYQTFFILFDECEKLIQDIHYRNSIENPINHFFRFRQKAFVSATPILAADPRLVEQGFRIVRIEPEYNYHQPLKLITTNNLAESLSGLLKECTGEEDIYIFCNSLDTPLSIAHEEPLLREAIYFCSEEGSEKLKELRIKEFRTEFAKPGKRNVLTSRFFSAIDIELRKQPHVILLSDLYGAPQSVIDPATEAIQIAGRFRNGVKSITHITSIHPELEYRDERELEEWIKGADALYREWLKAFRRATNPGRHELLLEALELSSYKAYLYDDNEVNPFLVQNLFEQEKVKRLYTNAAYLYDAYRNTPFFEVTHQPEEYLLTDNDRLERQRHFARKVRGKIVLAQLERINHLRYSTEEGKREYHDRLIKRLIRTESDRLLYDCYTDKGADFIREIDFSQRNMEKAIKEETTRQRKSNHYMSQKVRSRFTTGKEYPQKDVLIKLGAIYKRNGIPGRVTLQDLKLYFKVETKRISTNRFVIFSEKP